MHRYHRLLAWNESRGPVALSVSSSKGSSSPFLASSSLHSPSLSATVYARSLAESEGSCHALLRKRSNSKGPITERMVTQSHRTGPLAFSDHPLHSRQLLGHPERPGTAHRLWCEEHRLGPAEALQGTGASAAWQLYLQNAPVPGSRQEGQSGQYVSKSTPDSHPVGRPAKNCGVKAMTMKIPSFPSGDKSAEYVLKRGLQITSPTLIVASQAQVARIDTSKIMKAGDNDITTLPRKIAGKFLHFAVARVTTGGSNAQIQ